MKILVYFGHPAQYLCLRETLKRLIAKGHQVKVLIKTKDVLESLIVNDGMEYSNILPNERGRSKLSILISLLKRNIILFNKVRIYRPTILIGGDTSIAQIGKLLNINRITMTEDDYEVIKPFCDITYPFAQTILCPEVCGVGKWGEKKTGYKGYMKLGYLHPNVFKLDSEILKKYEIQKEFVLLRLAKLTAYHDFGVKGISLSVLDKLISNIEKRGFQVFISSEVVLESRYNKFMLKISPNDIHHIIAGSTLLISDSQSMSVEASMLGTPSIRISSLIGKISVLEELEYKFKLTFGVDPNDINSLVEIINNLLSIKDLKYKFLKRKKKMLAEKIDVTAFYIWFIENYPKSKKILKDNPDYQLRFK